MKLRGLLLACSLMLILVIPQLGSAQGELAATLEVLTGGVEVLRVNTVNWVPVNVEAIVGVGDRIRTDGTGNARITFFADGVDTQLMVETEYVIQRFEGDEETFNISAEVVTGQTIQRLERVLDSGSSYDVTTPGMELAARGTQFTIRVERTGRSAMLVTLGDVAAGADDSGAEVPAGFGVRSAMNDPLSDVVRATNFAELDSGLDGCTASVSFSDDVQLNARLGPSLDFARVGTVAPADINRFFGVNEDDGWYRIEFRGGFAWILSSNADLQENCAGLREFGAGYAGEDASNYSSLGEEINLDDLPPAPADDAVEAATPEATSEPE
jgi:hypothetical protein